MPEYVPTDCRVLWPSTVASIPAGFSRDTNLDGYFLSGAPAATESGGTGGAATHDHTSSAHSHTDVHTHQFTTTGASVGTVGVGTGFSTAPASAGHTHPVITTPASNGVLSSEVIDIDVADAQPEYLTALALGPNDGGQLFPALGIGFCISLAGMSADFVLCDGIIPRPDLDNRFVRIADAGNDAGEIGGKAVHSHTSQAHGHDPYNHSHADFVVANGGIAPIGTGVGLVVSIAHENNGHHTVSGLDIMSLTLENSQPITSDADNDPVHVKLYAVQNAGAEQSVPHGLILPYDGLLSAIPNNWYLCDSTNGTPDLRGRQAKLIIDNLLVGLTEGSDEHTHLGANHNHLDLDGHVHHYTFTNSKQLLVNIGLTTKASWTHTHASTSMSTDFAFSSSNTWTMSTEDGRQPYYEVQFVMYQDPEIAKLHIQGGHIEGGLISG